MRRARVLWAAVVVLGVAACNNPNISRRELVVVFKPGTTAQQQGAVLRACAGSTSKASPEPTPSDFATAANRIGDVRFRIDHADDSDLSRLEACLGRQPGVLGDQLPEDQ